jgi:FKBP-type peptidyl-prolyl cis-trans isomerase SlyD
MIADQKVVSLNYTVKDTEGQVVDSSEGAAPLVYLHGQGEEMVQVVPRTVFEGVENIETGMVFTAQAQNGPVQLTVAKIDGDDITVDPNHPLSGKTLHFSGSVIEVREATEEELTHGHVHGEGGHQHEEEQVAK